MTAFDRFERNLPALFDELATPAVPDYTDDLLARTAATRQRPGWAFPERWFPMSAITRRFAAVPRVPWRLGVAVAILAVTALVAALIAGALLTNRLPAYGPAVNGAIIFVDDSGNVVAGDPDTGLSRVVLANPSNTKPVFSQDGTRFFVLRPAAAGQQHIFVGDLEGNETQITKDSVTAWHYVGWSPNGDRILVRDDGGRILLLDTSRAAEPVSISKGLNMGTVWIGAGFNYRSSNAFRPPNGDAILFTGNDWRTLASVRPDGTGLRTILDVQGAGLGVSLDAAQWSPDGRQITFVVQKDIDGPTTTFIVNADGSEPRELSGIGHQWSPTWSPDGTQVAFELWTPPAAPAAEDAEWDPHPIAIVNVATGDLREVGPVHKDGYLSWDWSPDGTSILAVPRDGFGVIEIVDAMTGDTTTTEWAVDQPISWQRLPTN